MKDYFMEDYILYKTDVKDPFFTSEKKFFDAIDNLSDDDKDSFINAYSEYDKFQNKFLLFGFLFYLLLGVVLGLMINVG